MITTIECGPGGLVISGSTEKALALWDVRCVGCAGRGSSHLSLLSKGWPRLRGVSAAQRCSMQHPDFTSPHSQSKWLAWPHLRYKWLAWPHLRSGFGLLGAPSLPHRQTPPCISRIVLLAPPHAHPQAAGTTAVACRRQHHDRSQGALPAAFATPLVSTSHLGRCPRASHTQSGVTGRQTVTGDAAALLACGGPRPAHYPTTWCPAADMLLSPQQQ